jgi:maltose alpha-D-glucosyltransferase/alpha-amylase
MRFWLDMGVDGMRLDAVAHLYEREGTNCENLPETHAFLKRIRAEMDERYENRVLLGEVDQLPAMARPYFGEGDECQMVFHFPLMPRLFMALKREETDPIVRIVRESDFLPPTCQWAVFLRNHDELTLSTFTPEEREAMFEAYAPEPRMRLNFGIRRRLAPLLGNDRSRIEMAVSLLFSLPGAPVLYYGDELGMGDNVMLTDRDGVRTPMQWTPGPHAGFSSTTGALTMPLIEDAYYGYAGVNVAAQEGRSDSSLAQTRRMIRVRREHRAFSRGSIEFLESNCSHVLSVLRVYENDTILVIANLSIAPQSCDIRLPPELAGYSAFNLLDGVAYPSIGLDAYPLTLGRCAYLWLRLEAGAAALLSI